MKTGNRSFALKTFIASVALTPALAFSATWNVDTNSELRNALANAANGDTIVIAGGKTYQPSSSLNSSTLSGANGGANRTVAPQFMIKNKSNITIRGSSSSNRPKLQGTGVGDGKYVFYAQKANGLVLKDIEFRNATKGVIIDRSDNVTINNIRVENIGNEGLHFRDGSDNGETKYSEFYKIGMTRKDRGEALYICNDKKKWHPNYTSSGDDIYQENCNNHHIHHNQFLGEIGAEHIDIKEGTRGHNIHDNTFNAKITLSALKNAQGDYTKSIVHDKGYNNRIHNNTFNMANAIWYSGGGDWAAIRVEQVLDDGEYGANIYGHNGGYVYNTLTNSNNGSSNEFVVLGPSDGANNAKVGCDTINGSNPKYRVLSQSKSGLEIDGGIGNTGDSVVSGSTCSNYTNGTGSSSTTTTSTTSSSTTSSSTSSSSGGDVVYADWNHNGSESGQSTKHVSTSYTNGKVVLGLNASNNDPYIRFGGSRNIDGYDKVKIRIRNGSTNGKTGFQIFFKKNGGEGGNSKNFTVAADDNWKDITVDMSGKSNWNGSIDSLRIDGPSYGAGNFRIDTVTLIANGSSSGSSSSSSTGSTSSGGTGCLSYAFGSGLKELSFPSTSGGCVNITGGSLSNDMAIADSDANPGCDIRGTATGSAGGSHTVNGNWETPTNLSGNTLNISVSNGCKHFKLRVR